MSFIIFTEARKVFLQHLQKSVKELYNIYPSIAYRLMSHLANQNPGCNISHASFTVANLRLEIRVWEFTDLPRGRDLVFRLTDTGLTAIKVLQLLKSYNHCGLTTITVLPPLRSADSHYRLTATTVLQPLRSYSHYGLTAITVLQPFWSHRHYSLTTIMVLQPLRSYSHYGLTAITV